MKKILFAAVLVVGALASCKKDYTCECVDSYNGTTYGTSSVTITDTKNDAEAACNAMDSSTGTNVKECTIQ